MPLNYLTPDEAAREAERIIESADGPVKRSDALVARMAAEADRLIAARGGIARPRVPYRMERPEEDEALKKRMAKLETDSLADLLVRRLHKRDLGNAHQHPGYDDE
ncbi:MAG TPA: hypothetical protein VJ809_17200 [Pirellulales bacterium]|nr:hypothetical protein [Pirellulales bacterium]